MHSKWRYKICIFWVILGELESFRNYQGLSIVFSKILDAILSFMKVRIFLIARAIAFSNPKILVFLFYTKIAWPGGGNAKIWTLENCREFITYASKIVNGMVI